MTQTDYEYWFPKVGTPGTNELDKNKVMAELADYRKVLHAYHMTQLLLAPNLEIPQEEITPHNVLIEAIKANLTARFCEDVLRKCLVKLQCIDSANRLADYITDLAPSDPTDPMIPVLSDGSE
jgi:hypothetical protein